MSDFLKYLLQNNLITLVLSLGLLVFLIVQSKFMNIHLNFLELGTIIIIFLTIINSLEYSFENVSQAKVSTTIWVSHTIFCALNYILRPTIGLILVLQLRDKFDFKFFLLLTPIIMTIALMFFPFFNMNVVFIVDKVTNQWIGGHFRFVPYLCGILYIALAFILMFVKFKKEGIWLEFLALIFCIIGLIVASIVQIFDITGDITLPIIAASYVFFYIYIYIMQYRIDGLTKLSNRAEYEKDIILKKKLIRAVISIDFNDLKEYNETYGNEAGDEALIEISDFLREIPLSQAYRVGGDEFIVLSKIIGDDEIKEIVNQIKEFANDKSYSIAIGYQMVYYSLEESIREAERLMYDNKKIKEN